MDSTTSQRTSAAAPAWTPVTPDDLIELTGEGLRREGPRRLLEDIHQEVLAQTVELGLITVSPGQPVYTGSPYYEALSWAALVSDPETSQLLQIRTLLKALPRSGSWSISVTASLGTASAFAEQAVLQGSRDESAMTFAELSQALASSFDSAEATLPPSVRHQYVRKFGDKVTAVLEP